MSGLSPEVVQARAAAERDRSLWFTVYRKEKRVVCWSPVPLDLLSEGGWFLRMVASVVGKDGVASGPVGQKLSAAMAFCQSGDARAWLVELGASDALLKELDPKCG